MNPWTALLVGLLLGWLIEYAIDWFFWRRKSTDEQIVSDLQEQLKASEERSAELESQLAALGVGAAVGAVAADQANDEIGEEDIVLADESEEFSADESTGDEIISEEEVLYDATAPDIGGERFDEASELEALGESVEETELADAEEVGESTEEIAEAESVDDYAADADLGDEEPGEAMENDENIEETATDEGDEPILADAEFTDETVAVEEAGPVEEAFEAEKTEPDLEESDEFAGNDLPNSATDEVSAEEEGNRIDEDAFISGEGGQ